MLGLLLVVAGAVNLWLGYLIGWRRVDGLMAGYDMQRARNPERLARWIGGWTVGLGAACLGGGAGLALAPTRAGAIVRVMSGVILIGVVAMFAGARRHNQ